MKRLFCRKTASNILEKTVSSFAEQVFLIQQFVKILLNGDLKEMQKIVREL